MTLKMKHGNCRGHIFGVDVGVGVGVDPFRCGGHHLDRD